jgi:hypothetical protein
MGTELEHRDFLRFSHLSVTFLGRPQFFKVGMGPMAGKQQFLAQV